MRHRYVYGTFAIALMFLAHAAVAERVHQTVNGDQIHTGDGSNAVAKGQMEAKKVEGAANGQVAQVKGNTAQWGYVTCWFGLPAPEGKSIARFRLYFDGQKTAKYLLYIRGKDGQTQVGELKLPADATANSFVTV